MTQKKLHITLLIQENNTEKKNDEMSFETEPIVLIIKRVTRLCILSRLLVMNNACR